MGRNVFVGEERAVKAADTSLRRRLAVLTAVVVAIGGLTATAPPAVAAVAAADLPATVSADALPTAQIDGVAWTQAIAGGRVWVGGEFTTARPAGAEPGTRTVDRANLLSYDLDTGVLTSWNPGANGSIRAIEPSADGSIVYVSGLFTTIAGEPRTRLAAFDTATGDLLPWAPYANAGVVALAVHGDTVFVGGNFSALGKLARTRIGAVSATTGEPLPLTASLTGGYGVQALVVDPTGSKIVVAGSFTATNGSSDPGRGMAALDAKTGESLPWGVNSILRNAGTTSAIKALASDEDSVYGVGYDYGGTAEDDFEGTFRARWSDGEMVWMEDCHGDNYSVAVSGGVVYTASHDHYCGNIGGFPQSNPRAYRHTLSYAKEYLGNVLTPDPIGQKSYTGMPAATLLHWFPIWQVGTYTGQSQATWDVVADDDYVVYGGEFRQVNGVGQQGLVRFAKRTIAPNEAGPVRTGKDFPITAVSQRPGEVILNWTANHDPDDAVLTYEVLRADRPTDPVCTTTAKSNFWTAPALSCTDTSAVEGAVHDYSVRVSDAAGNQVYAPWIQVEVAAEDAGTEYRRAVLDDGAQHYWPLDEAGGRTATDLTGRSALTLTDVERGVAGHDADIPATRFAGTPSSGGGSATASAGLQRFTIEAWFQTTSTEGGKVVSFGSRSAGDSAMHDRSVYLDGEGRVTFGVAPSGYRTVTSSAGFNDGRWHHVVATLSGSGMALYLDGVRVAERADTTSAQSYRGYWRVGGERLGSWPEIGTSGYLAGAIADAAIYPAPLTAVQVRTHYRLAMHGESENTPPVAAFEATTSGHVVSVDGSASTDADAPIAAWRWDFGDGATASGATATHTYAGAGTYGVSLTVVDDEGAAHTTSRDVVVTDPPPSGVAAADSFDRDVAGGWGSAPVGGAWSLRGSASTFSVGGGSGILTITDNVTHQALIESAPVTDVRVEAGFSVDKIASGQYVFLVGRSVAGEQYRLRARIDADGSVQLVMLRGDEPVDASVTVPGITIVPGATYRIAFDLTGSGTTTLRGKIWPEGEAEPSFWHVVRTDATPSLQTAGAFGVATRVSSQVGAYPVVLSFHDVAVTIPGVG